MTLVKRIWDLRGQVQKAINNKNFDELEQVVNELQSSSFEFAVVNSRIASAYSWKRDVLDIEERANRIKPIINNVKNLLEYRKGDKTINLDFGNNDCVMHTIWIMRAKFERLQYLCEKSISKEEAENLYKELMNLCSLLKGEFKSFYSDDDLDAIYNIKEEINGYYTKHNIKEMIDYITKSRRNDEI